MEIIKRMERMIFNFLWKGPDKVTRHSLINSVKNGGLNLMDIETQMKASRLSWIPRILDSTIKGLCGSRILIIIWNLMEEPYH